MIVRKGSLGKKMGEREKAKGKKGAGLLFVFLFFRPTEDFYAL